jgi:succinate-acetate transporter protein
VPAGDGITPEANVRIFVRPLASALPLGFFSFAVGMLLLAGSGNGWLPPSDQHTVGILLAAFVFPLETIAAVIAFLARDTFGATGLGLFSSSWLALGLTDVAGPPGALNRAVGLYDFAFAVVIVLLAAAAVLGKPLIAVALGLSAFRAVFFGVYEFGASQTFARASGWIAVAIFAVAVYGGIALLIEDVQQREVLPVFRVGTSRHSVEGDLHDQLRGIGREAGVRHTL